MSKISNVPVTEIEPVIKPYATMMLIWHRVMHENPCMMFGRQY